MMHAEPSRVRPVAMSDLMVRALQANCKTVTRRLSTSPLAHVRPGDLLWVREAIIIEGVNCTPGRLYVRFEADGFQMDVPWPRRMAKPLPGVRGPRAMPLELSRMTLRVIHVHEERLHAIQERDCYDEGIGATGLLDAADGDPVAAFARFWDGQHTKDGTRWADNPEVVAIRFACMHRGVKALLPGLGHGGVR